jgi:PAS domain S-box-containing protein
LTRSNSPMRDVFDLVQESIVARNLDGRITAWNAASERLYGWSSAQAHGKPIHEFLHTSREAAAGMEAELRAQGRWTGQFARRTANGTRVILRATCTILREDVDGGPEIIETATDITALQDAEEALKRVEHRYYNMFQAMSVSFWELDFSAVGQMVQKLTRGGVSDLDHYFAANLGFVREMTRATRVLDVNDQSVQLFGRGAKQEMLGSVEPYWPGASLPIYAASVVAAVQGLPRYSAETRLRSLNGREFDVQFTACFPPEMLARGKLLIGIVDISADKKAKSAVESSEERYRSLFHVLPVALVQLDRRELAGVFEALHAEGVSDLQRYFTTHPSFYEYASHSIKVVEVNRQTVELFGARDASPLLGPVARIWSESPETIKRSMQARFQGASRFEAEMKIRTFDGELRDVLYVAHFPEAFGQEALGLGCLVDVSDRVKAQTMLAEVQAEFAHAARVSMLGELTASIAHEINQPLGAILTNGEAALLWLKRPRPNLDELRALAGRTIADARRAADIIRRIRDMATRTETERSRVALNAVIEDVLLFLNPELKKNDVETTLDLAPDLPDVMGDRVQLQQVFVNLAVNAQYAMAGQEDRRLVIRTERVEGDVVRAEIEDTGHGIPPENLNQLFQSFFTTKRGGMGIGLAVCRSIIEAHAGRIEAANRPGGGARFRFTLPALVEHPQA